MPKIEGYHPVCHNCGDDNEEPKYKWCPGCRMKERVRRRRERIQRGDRRPSPALMNPCGMGYVETVRAGDPTDTLPDGFQVRPGHKEGWWEII